MKFNRFSNHRIDYTASALLIAAAFHSVIAVVGGFWAASGSALFLLACVIPVIALFRTHE
ncbi:cytochrome oxidase subunit III [Aliiroseovarius sp. YM-037]|uniref:cytochrome oxidase subunit III n=1 Tax=Aliiroseovarius sp. YM-037 TaxID=3341728 RepID=UPI003A810F57